MQGQGQCTSTFALCYSVTDALWGLRRTNIAGAYTEGDTCYSYTTGSDTDPNGAGRNVDIFVLDTGIYCNHNDFLNKIHGTCTLGYDAFGGDAIDRNGHGTHV